MFNKPELSKINLLSYARQEKKVLDMLANAEHSIIHMHCALEDANNLYLVMPYARNGNLLSHLTRVGRFDVKCTRFYAAEMLHGLEFLHSRGIVHRDLKPENMLMDDLMHIRISDFGFAKISGEQTRQRLSSFVGTMEYVSPEVLRKIPTTKASDLWALGVIMYQMVSGRKPFGGAHDDETFRNSSSVRYPSPETFCKVTAPLIKKLLVVEPFARLGAKDEHGYPSIRGHPFFEGFDFTNLHLQTPPQMRPYREETSQGLSFLNPSSQDNLSFLDYAPSIVWGSQATVSCTNNSILLDKGEEFIRRWKEQQATNKWHEFAGEQLIFKDGKVRIKKGLFYKERVILLTSAPSICVIDALKMRLENEIFITVQVSAKQRTFKNKFFLQTVKIFARIF